MKKSVAILLSFLCGLLLGVGGGYLSLHDSGARSVQKTPEQSKYVWKFQETEPDEIGIPRTAVQLIAGENSYILGTYDGSCREVRVGERGVLGEMNDPSEISRIQCWFAGAGDEMGIFEEDGKIHIKAGELEEGNEEADPFRGNFTTIAEL